MRSGTDAVFLLGRGKATHKSVPYVIVIWAQLPPEAVNPQSIRAFLSQISAIGLICPRDAITGGSDEHRDEDRKPGNRSSRQGGVR
ncbi:hypothetical protein AGR7A_Cc120182 [Agrobacterium deltaense NCPPB 1641]|uniref:Uncharacterized protein n=1 Tax=Agrobacterium deltaense NCPPB 1641 TaxID=1183425 RepID=A0A1S7TJ82_9HYPH|nr:hypothetical protein AGR7A_Cc120182 [Agrobacterium deltaense NCPPB 1641]